MGIPMRTQRKSTTEKTGSSPSPIRWKNQCLMMMSEGLFCSGLGTVWNEWILLITG